MTVPPGNLDAERATLGAILSASSYGADAGWRIIARCRQVRLRPEHFTLPTNGLLYALLLRLEADGVSCDPVSAAAGIEQDAKQKLPVEDELAAERLLARLTALASEVVAFGNVEHWAGIVIAAARERGQGQA